MKTNFITIILSFLLYAGLYAQVEVTVNHSTEGSMSSELSSALAAASVTDPLTVTKLIVVGSAYMNLADCQSIRNTFRTGATIDSPGTLTLDLSNAVFQNDSIPRAGTNTNGAFNELYPLKTVILPPGIRVIGAYAFRYCRRLEDINLSEGLEVIETQAFANNAINSNTVLSLTSLPNTVKSIGDYAFASCNGLALTSLPSGLRGIISTFAFQNTSIAISSIPEGVTQINNHAFNCGNVPERQKITSLIFPASLVSLSANAFANQVNIQSVEFNTATPPVEATPVFPSGIVITVPYNSGANKAAYESSGLFSAFNVVEKELVVNEGHFPVLLRVIDRTKGVRTSNEQFSETQNVLACLSDDLRFQGFGTEQWYYPLFGFGGSSGLLEKNDTAWIWQATIEAPEGTHVWCPYLKTNGYKPMNKTAVYYGENDNLTFSVSETGEVTGVTEIIIRETQYPVTLKVIDRSKGVKTNDINNNETNLYIEGGKPSSPEGVQTNLYEEFISVNSNFVPSSDWDVFDFQSGVNIGVWLSQTSNRGGTTATAYFKESDVQQLKQLGFDHIRLPVDETELFNNTSPRTFKAATVQHIHNAISWCQKLNMRVILDFHILRSHYFNDTNNMTLWSSQTDQDLFIEMWEKMSDEFGHYPRGLLAYELLNEAVPPTAAAWNTLSARAIAAIRAKEPNRLIVIGGMSHNSASALASLTVPANDPNIILVYHFYTPHLLTHYQAPWMDGLKNLTIPLHYPGQLVAKADVDTITIQRHKDVVNYYNGYYDKNVLKGRMQIAIDRSKALGLKLYVSETGCIRFTESSIRTAWMKDVAEIFKENKIAFSLWNWKANFGILNDNGTVRDQSTINAATKGGSWKYSLYPQQGNPIEKNDTAWIWSTSVQVKTGCYTWRPYAESTNGTINSTIYEYDNDPVSDGFLQFNIGLDGEITGNTTLTIPELFATVSNPDNSSNHISVYPTAFDDYILVNGAEESVEIYNCLGNKIIKRKISEKGKIDTSLLSNGIYLLVVDGRYSYKLIK